MSKHDLASLDALYKDGESADAALFTEMRSNCLLHSSDHYKKISQALDRGLRESRTAEAIRLKLTKNHIQVITKTYINNIVSEAPGVKVLPFNQKQLQDQKDAELSQAVWSDAEEKQNIESKIDGWAQDFVVIGEMAAKIYWDPTKGAFKGYRQATDENGNPLFKAETGDHVTQSVGLLNQPLEPVASEEPVFEGQMVIEPILGFNIIRDKQAESMNDSRFLCIRRMVAIEDVNAMLVDLPEEEKEEKSKFVVESGKTTFKVFDATSGDYSDAKGQVMLREFYFRPCAQYPNGYFYIATDLGILFEDELPYGIFPIITGGFDNIQSSPRARSIIKPLRAPQAEINRMASMISTTQITLGDDKIITVAGSKLSKGAQWAGLREFSVAGPPPTILPGRSGEQFEGSLAREVNEIYRLANMEYETKESQGVDPQAMLYKNLAQRKKYALYVRRFERFLKQVAQTYLQLAKRYLPDEYLIKAVGKREFINIAEFRRVEDNGFNIKVKPMSQDIDSMFGKQLNINQTLQYIGKDLPKEVQGRLLRMMPFMNDDQAFDYLTIDDENIDSDILALDRGESRPANPEDNHSLYIQRLTHRKKQADFALLDPQIQELYEQKIQMHRQMEAQVAAELQAAQAGFIPSGGGLVKVDFYGPDGKRITLPYESIQWLVQKMDQQGQTQEDLAMLDQHNQSQILQAAQAMNQQQGMGQHAVGMQQPMPPMPQ
ncbi:hypothetical protein D3C87_125060 [compost metagenome]